MELLVLPDLAGVPLDALDGLRLLGSESTPTEAVRGGLSVDAFDAVQGFLGVPARELAGVIRVAPRTLQRRREGGRLEPDESERLLRVARVAELALAVLEDANAAAGWLTRPKRFLGGETPLAYLDTEPGAREVETALYAVEYSGVA